MIKRILFFSIFLLCFAVSAMKPPFAGKGLNRKPNRQFYPLIIKTWEKGLFSHDLFDYTDPFIFEPNKSIAFISKSLNNRDPFFRIKIYKKLGTSNNPKAVTSILQNAQSEKNERVLAAILKAFRFLPADKTTKTFLANHMESTNPNIKKQAIYAYARLNSANYQTLLKIFRTEKNLSLKISILRAMLSRSKKLDIKTWLTIAQSAKNSDIKEMALSVLVAEKNHHKNIETFLLKTAKGTIGEKFSIINSITAESAIGKKLIIIFKDDPHPSIRSSAMMAMGKIIDQDFLAYLQKGSRDQDSDVKKSAVISLQFYPQKEAIDSLLIAFADKEFLIQEHALESAFLIQKTFNTSKQIAKAIQTSKRQDTRLRALQILAEISQGEKWTQMVSKQLIKEKRESNIAACIYMLGKFKYLPAEQKILSMQAKKPFIRAEVAFYLGQINKEKHYPLLKKMAQLDKDANVRERAIYAIGLTQSAFFNKTLIAIIKSVREPTTEFERAAVCWAAGRLKKPSNFLFKMIEFHLTRPVLPGPTGEKTFEPIIVQISGLLAIVMQSKKDPKNFTKLKNKLIKKFITKPKKARGKSIPFPYSPETHCYGIQASKYFSGAPIILTEKPKSTLHFLPLKQNK